MHARHSCKGSLDTTETCYVDAFDPLFPVQTLRLGRNVAAGRGDGIDWSELGFLQDAPGGRAVAAGVLTNGGVEGGGAIPPVLIMNWWWGAT